jgi:hypothetical protein
MYCDYGFLEAQKAEGNTMDKLLDPVIYAHRACSRDMPDDLTLALHLCRGNLPKGVEGEWSLRPRMIRMLMAGSCGRAIRRDRYVHQSLRFFKIRNGL